MNKNFQEFSHQPFFSSRRRVEKRGLNGCFMYLCIKSPPASRGDGGGVRGIPWHTGLVDSKEKGDCRGRQRSWLRS